MREGSSDASALLGMRDFVVLSSTEEDGDVYLLVETAADFVGCPKCEVWATGHGRSEVQVRDLPTGGRPVRLVWRRRRWLCTDPDCPARTFLEQTPLVEGCLTRRAVAEICQRVGQDGASVAQVAREFGVSWATAMDCVRRHGEPLVDDERRLEGVEALGLDEHKMLAAAKDRRSFFVTSFVNLGTGRLLDVVRGRSGTDVAYWLTQMGPMWRQGVSAVAIDPHRRVRQRPAPPLAPRHRHRGPLSLDQVGQCRHRRCKAASPAGDDRPPGAQRRPAPPTTGSHRTRRQAGCDRQLAQRGYH